jgi:hypothetical protein
MRLQLGVIVLAGLLAGPAPLWAGDKEQAPAKKDATEKDASKKDAGKKDTGKKAKKPKWKSWYPKSIKPPKGTRYPCKVTAMPKGFAGFPKEHVRYLDHAFSLVIRSCWAKLKLMETWRVQKKGKKLSASKLKKAWATYEKELKSNLKKLAKETPPTKELAVFHKDLKAALELQLAFFKKGSVVVGEQSHPAGYNAMLKIPEGRKASHKLLRCWSTLDRLYKGWNKKDKKRKDATYHHLCALDVF